MRNRVKSKNDVHFEELMGYFTSLLRRAKHLKFDPFRVEPLIFLCEPSGERKKLQIGAQMRSAISFSTAQEKSGFQKKFPLLCKRTNASV